MGEVIWAEALGSLQGTHLRRFSGAIDIQTGKMSWELPEIGPGNTDGSTLATASELLFYADDSGMLRAMDSTDGRPLWNFQTNQNWNASPMTYMFDNTQYVSIAQHLSRLQNS